MKHVIYGKVFDTSTALRVCTLPCPLNPDDFGWHETALFRSPRGSFFLAGRGGPGSRWGFRAEGEGWQSGAGMEVVSESDAREYTEAAKLSVEEYEKVFGACEVG